MLKEGEGRHVVYRKGVDTVATVGCLGLQGHGDGAIGRVVVEVPHEYDMPFGACL